MGINFSFTPNPAWNNANYLVDSDKRLRSTLNMRRKSKTSSLQSISKRNATLSWFEMIIYGVSLSRTLTFSSLLDGTSSTIFDVRQIKIITLNVFTTIDFQKLLTYWTVIISQHIFSKITSSQYFETEQIIAIHGASITMMTMTMATLLTGYTSFLDQTSTP